MEQVVPFGTALKPGYAVRTRQNLFQRQFLSIGKNKILDVEISRCNRTGADIVSANKCALLLTKTDGEQSVTGAIHAGLNTEVIGVDPFAEFDRIAVFEPGDECLKCRYGLLRGYATVTVSQISHGA